MDDPNKALAKSYRWTEAETFPDTPEVDAPSSTPDAAQDHESTKEKTVDRWFYEQRNNQRVPKRLQIANEALVTHGGPLKLKGNIKLIDEDGNVSHANQLSLCRCGASTNKPLCNNKHLDIEFLDGGAVERLSDCMPIKRPQTITVTCVKNGPLKFRGYLRIYNMKGQECTTIEGSLCRCGKSSKKPFCDNTNSGCHG